MADEAVEAGKRAIFEACDVDKDGLVSHDDLETSLRRLGGRHIGGRALFAVADKTGAGALRYEEFCSAVFKPLGQALPQSDYLDRHGVGAFVASMLTAADAMQPRDPYTWMMEYLAKHRPRKAADDSEGVVASASAPGKEKASPAVRVNTSAVLRKSPKKLLDIILAEPGWKAVEQAVDEKSQIYFTWDSRAFLARLAHPSCTGSEAAPLLCEDACINRIPGMGHLCDKVNMALALRLLQKLWPEKFRFWPRSWLLPKETDELKAWIAKHRGQAVIVKPADGSLGEGIFIAHSAMDLESKLMARPNWGAGFCALAQKYLPNPLLIDGLKFDLRLYVVVVSTDPCRAFLCHEGLARFCTTKYEEPTPANAGQHYMHLTNFSVNKKSKGFVKASDPFDVESRASKRPLCTLLSQIEAQEARAGRVFDREKFFKSCEEVVAVLLQSLAPILNVTADRVAKEAWRNAKMRMLKARQAKAKAKPGRRKSDDTDSSEEDEEDGHDSDDDEECSYAPQCFQVLGVDVLLDAKIQPWLLEVNGRPSMDIDEPVRMDDSQVPPGKKTCICRDMDGEEHIHMQSPVDTYVKSLAMRGAFELAIGRPTPGKFSEVDFAAHGGDGDLEGTLSIIARLFQKAGGSEKAFTTYGMRRALKGAIDMGLDKSDLDAAVSRWRHQGYRQAGDLERDTADIGVLDFAELLQEVAMLQKDADPDDPLGALTSLIEDCDPDED